MILFKKVIKIDVVQKVDYPDSLGMVSLYPKGTKRTIKALTFTGWKIYEQKSIIEYDVSVDGTIYYNVWEFDNYSTNFKKYLNYEK